MKKGYGFWVLVGLSLLLLLAAGWFGWGHWKADLAEKRREKAQDLAVFFRAHRAAFSQAAVLAIGSQAFTNEHGALELNTANPAVRARLELLRRALGQPPIFGYHESLPDPAFPHTPPRKASAEFDYQVGGDLYGDLFWDEGVIYLPQGPEAPTTVVKNLDSRGWGADRGDFLMPLEGAWYLYFDNSGR